ncbi:MAG: hypothetical protein F7C33_04915 [Desulfurococcales archaeon]|nr:hypothetical protein [Desulfurococcales archaeon]
MIELEIIEEYLLEGEKRYKVRVKGTRIILNVSASSPEEALEKASRLYEKISGKLRT